MKTAHYQQKLVLFQMTNP
jgi:hypothetical protein